MTPEFNGIERRVSELCERLSRLAPLRAKPSEEFEQNPYLRDAVERNLQVAVQCCLDICHRIIALEGAPKAVDQYGAILAMGELGVLPPDFARSLAPIAGFRNILVHEYVRIEWSRVYRSLQEIDALQHFADFIRGWLREGNRKI
ncbi:MAG: DUF86 domain-containing protein [Coprothermobacterota bacterium]|nr:DUF86 domain-containing protein [Coprothermobacterota bacterium]